MHRMPRHSAVLAATLLAACGNPAAPRPQNRELRFSDTAAVRVSPAGSGQWLLLFEKLQPQFLFTVPMRNAGLLGAGSVIERRYDAPEGWTLIDAVGHPSGDVSLLSVRVDFAAQYPMRAMISRFTAAGARLDRELSRLPPPAGAEPPPAVLSSFDRARLAARGEDLFAVVRWANNGVQAYRLAGPDLDQKWAAWVEPAAPLGFIGIIGGGFDNFHQGDNAAFVYGDVDDEGDLHVAVASTADLIPEHDAFFGEDLTSQTDPASFDFGTAIVTRITADGVRTSGKLMGSPGRNKRLLNLRVAGDSVVLVGRVKTGQEPGSWDGWLLRARAATGEPVYERNVDVQNGDMFWDVTALPGGKLLAVGSTNYTQNPAGLSVSDARDPLALVLDAAGQVEKRLDLPVGPAGRGNEAMSASVGTRGEVAISGVQNAPGTHAEVFSDAFLVVRPAGP